MLFKTVILAVMLNCITADFRLGKDKNYELQYFYKANWHNAVLYCRYNGMQLATIETKEQQTYLEKLIESSGLAKELFWISGSDLDQPDNANGNENCMMVGTNYKWNDAVCGDQYYFICERAVWA